MAAVEIGVDVEEMRFEPRHQPADRRPQADIGDAVDRVAVERIVGAIPGHAHRIDPERRPQILAEPEIGGRKADRAAARSPTVTRPSISQKRPSWAAASRGLPSFNSSRIWVEE